MLSDEGHHAARYVNADSAGRLRALGGVLDLAADGLAGHAKQACQQLHLDLVVEDGGLGHHGEARTVADDLLSVAVQDAATRRGGVDGAGPV